MSSPFTISIIVPAYNMQQFIDDCLQHILAQMQASHELIVVDDGSTDGTADRVRQMRDTHPQHAIRLVEQANQGISGARNTGLQHARGDYIAFVDSDDRLLPDALAALERVIAEQRPDVIATGFRMWHPDAPGKDRDIGMSYTPGVLITDQDTILNTFFADRHMYVWCKVCRRDIYAQLEMPLFPPQRLFEDVAVVPRLLERCRTLYYLPQALLAYRQHPTSITRVISERWCVDFVSALGSVKPAFERAGVSAAVRAHFDVAASHFYIGVVKNSYQLPAGASKAVRGQVKALYVDSLFGEPREVLAGMAGDKLQSTDRGHDSRTARQVGQALSGSTLFHLKQTVSRKVKLWQRMAHTRRAAGRP
ncbi:MAG: glycosyltransferase [Pseudomonadota bacterium]